MSGETLITVVGNLVEDPELRFTPAGVAVAKFKVASTPRTFDRESNSWKDGQALFLPCSVWRQQAEQCAESLQKGMRVIVVGRLTQRSYEDREGVKRTVMELDVEEVGPALRYATAKVTKASSSSGQGPVQSARREQGAVSAGDPWSSSTPGGQQAGGWGGGEEPPF